MSYVHEEPSVEVSIHEAAISGDIELIQVILDRKEASLKDRNEKGYTPFLLFIKNNFFIGNEDKYKWFIDNDCINDFGGKVDNTPFLLACKHNDIPAMKFFLQNGSKISETTSKGCNAILNCAKHGNIDACQYILSIDPSLIDKCNTNGENGVHTAASYGQLDFIKFLYDNGCPLDVPDNDKDTPIIIATTWNYLDIIKWLYSKGCNINGRNENNQTPFLLSMGENNIEIAKWIYEQNPDCIHDTDIFGYDSMAEAADVGSLEMVQFLRQLGQSFSCVVNMGDGVIHLAIKNGNLELVKYIMDNANENELIFRNSIEMTPFLLACENGKKDIAEYFLIEKGSSIDERDCHSSSGIILASINGHNNIIEWLVDLGCSIEDKNSVGSTCLLNACINGKLETVKWLIEHGSDIHYYANENTSAIQLACESGNLELVKYLLDIGLVLDNECMFFASWGGSIEVVEFLYSQNIPIDEENSIGITPIMNTIKVPRENMDLIKWFYNKGVKFNNVCKNGLSPFELAFINDREDVIRWLFKKQPLLFNRENTDKQNSVTHLAAIGGSVAIMEYLDNINMLEIEAKNNLGYTPLFSASRISNMECVKWLLDHGASVNYKSDDGMTPLLYACAFGKLEVAKELYNEGADLYARSNEGYSAIIYAAMCDNLDLIIWLHEQGLQLDDKTNEYITPIHQASISGQLHIIKWLCDNGISIRHSISNGGGTCLIYATSNNRIDVVKWLLEEGADIEQTNDYNNTALTMACKYEGNLETIEYLYSKGANIHILDNNNSSALHSAAKIDLETVKWLVERDIEIDAKNNKGNTPLLLAAKKNNIEIVKYLIDNGASINETNNNGDTIFTISKYPEEFMEEMKLLERSKKLKKAQH